jgi:hypothetical protein
MKSRAIPVKKRFAAAILVATLAGSFAAAATVTTASAAPDSTDKIISH